MQHHWNNYGESDNKYDSGEDRWLIIGNVRSTIEPRMNKGAG